MTHCRSVDCRNIRPLALYQPRSNNSAMVRYFCNASGFKLTSAPCTLGPIFLQSTSLPCVIHYIWWCMGSSLSYAVKDVDNHVMPCPAGADLQVPQLSTCRASVIGWEFSIFTQDNYYYLYISSPCLHDCSHVHVLVCCGWLHTQ